MKKLKFNIIIEIDNAKEFRKTWKFEGYNCAEDFLNDYISSNFFIEDFMDFDFEIKNIEVLKEK